MSEWHYLPPNEEMIWARNEDSDPYGMTREVVFDRVRNELNVRQASNDRASHLVAQVGVDVGVVVEVLKLAGYTIMPPPEE